MAVLRNCLTFSRLSSTVLKLCSCANTTLHSVLHTHAGTHVLISSNYKDTLLGECSACIQLVPVLLLIKALTKNLSAKDTIWLYDFVSNIFQSPFYAEIISHKITKRMILANSYSNAVGKCTQTRQCAGCAW